MSCYANRYEVSANPNVLVTLSGVVSSIIGVVIEQNSPSIVGILVVYNIKTYFV